MLSGFPAYRDIRGSVSRVVVVVPAHNEAQLLPRCLASLEQARRRVSIDVRVVVVLDACDDTSRLVVGSADVVRTVAYGNVGAARAVGFATAGRSHARETWFATTDADCEVPATWLEQQVNHAHAGARAVCGTVTIADWSGLGAEVQARYEQAYTNHSGHRHIHGANFGVAAHDYWAVGGFAALATGEDVDLVQRLQHNEIPITWAADTPVKTSSRTRGRARGGFADHLRTLQCRTRDDSADSELTELR